MFLLFRNLPEITTLTVVRFAAIKPTNDSRARNNTFTGRSVLIKRFYRSHFLSRIIERIAKQTNPATSTNWSDRLRDTKSIAFDNIAQIG